MDIDGVRLDFRRILARNAAAPTLVFLHEGLGSVELWRDFPDRVAAATGCGALVYSRRGYGQSDPIAGPRRPDYMHHEALAVLPKVLAAQRIEEPVLIGHSDGASIALIHAGSGYPARALVLMAPHVFVEDVTVASIAGAKETFLATDLKTRMARYHRDAEASFWGWNDIWLHPDFRDWNIEEYLPGVACPALLIQGLDDEYGTMAQLDAVARGVKGPVERVELAACKHSPHRDQPEKTLQAIAAFLRRHAGVAAA